MITSKLMKFPGKWLTCIWVFWLTGPVRQQWQTWRGLRWSCLSRLRRLTSGSTRSMMSWPQSWNSLGKPRWTSTSRQGPSKRRSCWRTSGASSQEWSVSYRVGGGAAVEDEKFDFLNFLFTFKQKRSLLQWKNGHSMMMQTKFKSNTKVCSLNKF